MPSTKANGITIEYEVAGDPGAPPLLLVMGLGAQLVAWDPAFVAELVDRGFYVISFDNRDAGLSTSLDDAGTPDVMAAFAGGLKPPYLLDDMADDAAGLLDALGIESAHVLGVSMGGMIVQALAIGHRPKIRSMVSIMSTTGAAGVGAPHAEAMAALLRPPPADREGALEGAVESWKVIGSPGFAFDEERIRSRAAVAYDRSFRPEGTARQIVGIICSPDRTPALRQLDVPTLVIHGEADPLVDPSGGRATADAVPGASLWLVPGMGHDLPPELFGEIADRVAAHCLGS